MRTDRERLTDIVEAIVLIEKHGPKTREQFLDDLLLRTFAVHYLEVIGEASARLSLAIKVAHKEVPWSRVVSMRNTMVHEYHAIDPDIIWRVIERDLPPLKTAAERMLEELP